MKKIFLILLICMPLIIFSNGKNYDAKNNLSEVVQVEGMYIFYLSKPLAPYDYLGTYRIILIWKNTPDRCLSKLIRKTRKKFPNAQAIIITPDMNQCDAIKFRE